MAGLIGFPSASLRSGPMKIKKGKIIKIITGAILDPILAENTFVTNTKILVILL